MSVGQHENKSGYYCNFKTRSGVDPGYDPGHKSKRVNPGQCKNKNYYYYSFKI